MGLQVQRVGVGQQAGQPFGDSCTILFGDANVDFHVFLLVDGLGLSYARKQLRVVKCHAPAKAHESRIGRRHMVQGSIDRPANRCC